MLHVQPSALLAVPSFNPIAYVADLRTRGIQPSISFGLNGFSNRVGIDISTADPEVPFNCGPELTLEEEQLVVSVLMAEEYIAVVRASGMIVFPSRSSLGVLHMSEIGQEEEGTASYGSCERRLRDRREISYRSDIAPGVLAAVLCADLGLDPNDPDLNSRVNELHAAGGLKVEKIPSLAEQNDLLLSLGDEMEIRWAAYCDQERLLESINSEEADHALEDAWQAVSVIVSRIEPLQASTLTGVRVKARALAWCHDSFDCSWIDPANLLNGGRERPTTDVRIAAAIASDLLAMQAA